MRAILAAYCAGVLLGTFVNRLQLTALTSLCAALLLAALASGLKPAHRRWRQRLCLAVSLLLGLGYHALWAERQLSRQLPPALAERNLLVAGEISDIPVPHARATGFQLRVKSGPEELVGRLLRLNDYQGLALAAGQRWQFEVRLRPPRGLANPGGFDSEAWYLQHNIAALGYVRASPASLLGQNKFSLAFLRGALLERLAELLPVDSHASAILPALLLGADSALSPDLKQLFARTGTSHLFVISGLHIGLVAACVLFIVDKGMRQITWFSTRVVTQHLGAIAALMAALFYALVTGFELPAQRAVIMLWVFLLASLWAQPVNKWFRFWLALALVLMINPLAASRAGFWFSFCAVAVLLLTLPTDRRESVLVRWLRPQLAIFIVMFLPLSVWIGQVSLLAPVINILAIPFIGLLIVPLAFMALFVGLLNDTFGGILFVGLSMLLDGFIACLESLLSYSPHLLTFSQVSIPAPGPVHLVLGVTAVILTLLPWPLVWRCLSIPLLLPVFVSIYAPLLPGKSEALTLRVFDVGQGLALLLSAGGRHLLYDTGAGDAAGFSMAESVILPALRQFGIRHLDRLVISHWDNDHAGGVGRLLTWQPRLAISASQMPSDSLLLSGTRIDLCRAGQHWRWGEASFEVLHPLMLAANENDNSCVLQIRFGAHTILVPGDISRTVEYQLALRFADSLASTVLIAPHHGSKSSSSYPLLKLSQPQWVVFSAGANNSFGHPDSAVARRYAEAGVGLLATAASGMITFRFDGSGAGVNPQRFRVDHSRYWRRSQNDYWCRYREQVCDTLSR